MAKYITITMSGIITRIVTKTDVPGYTEGVLEVFLPDETKMTQKESRDWVKQNNKRMTAICDFMNTWEKF